MGEYALISVYDKEGVVDLAKGLIKLGYKIISTGGTGKKLKENGIEVIDVSDITNFPEMLSDRVKTLHPKIHGGLLYVRGNKQHEEEAKKYELPNIEVVVVNLYPFVEAVKEDPSIANAVKNIDIGGPTLIRSAAKNYESVYVVVDPKDYGELLKVLETYKTKNLAKNNDELLKFRQMLALKVWNHVAHYDTEIEKYFRKTFGGEKYPKLLNLTFEKIMDLRYGENPHQSAALYEDIDRHPSIADAVQLHGKQLSYNNVLDLNSALGLIREFEQTTAIVSKHNNPCGVASDDNLLTAYREAKSVDPEAAFGGIVALNRTCTPDVAKEIIKTFIEIVVAPDYDEEALNIMKKKKNLRIIKFDVSKKPGPRIEYRSVLGGLLVQDNNIKLYDKLEVVTKRKPTEEEMRSLIYVWKIAKHVKSNTIVLGKYGRAIGIGAGQQKRIDAAKLAAMIAKDYSGNFSLKHAVMASDAFFPFRDGVDYAHSLGITAIIQPGGSIRDKEVIAAADEYGIAMVFTGVRQFRH